MESDRRASETRKYIRVPQIPIFYFDGCEKCTFRSADRISRVLVTLNNITSPHKPTKITYKLLNVTQYYGFTVCNFAGRIDNTILFLRFLLILLSMTFY